MAGSGGSKRKRIVLIVAGILIIAGYVFYRLKKEAFLDHQLKDLVRDKTNQLYKITYDSIHVDEAAGNVYIKNLVIKGDTARQLQMLNSADANAAKALLDVFIPEVKVVHFKTARALLSKELVCSQVIISNPKVTLYLFPGQAPTREPKKQAKELYRQILGNLDLIKADSVSLINSEVVVKDFYTKETKFHTYNTSIGLTEVAIDSTYNQDTTRTLFCKEMRVTTQKAILGDRTNTAEVSNLSFDTRSNLLWLGKLEYDAFKNNGSFKGMLEGILVKEVSWTGPVENSEIGVGDIVLTRGEVETVADGKGSKGKSLTGKPILTGWIKRFTLKSLQLKSALFTRKLQGKAKTFKVIDNAVYIRDLVIDRSTLLNEDLISSAKEIQVTNNKISLVSDDNLYEYRFLGIKVNSLSRKIIVNSVQVIPTLNEAAFAKKARYQRDRYDATINNINCNDVDLKSLVKGEIKIGSVVTSNNSLNIFHDLSYPIDSAKKRGLQENYPHQMLHNLDLPIDIKKLSATKTTIEYKEKNPKSQSSGRVRFVNSSITITNISNSKPKPGERIGLDFASSFLNQIPMKANITFYADEWRRGKFSVEAMILKQFDATVLNQLLQPMSLAKMDKGTIESFKINITADTGISRGSLTLGYKDLKISLLKKNGTGYDKKGVFSFLANILVKNNNEQKPGMRTATIEIAPNRYKSFFNFIWMSIFTGAKQILLLKI